MAVGRKIKDIKRKTFGTGASSTKLKVRKTDNKTFAEILDFVTDAEVKSISEELRQNKINRQNKLNLNRENHSSNFFYNLIKYYSCIL